MGKKKKQLVHAQVTALPLWRFTHVSAVHLMIRGRCSAHLNGHLPISPSRPFSQTNQHDQHYQRHSILPIFFPKIFPKFNELLRGGARPFLSLCNADYQ